MIRISALVLSALFLSTVGCVSRSERTSRRPPTAPPGRQTLSVQIWNHFRRDATFRITAISADGSSSVTLAESLHVPKPGPFRPDLGGDPNATGYAHAVVTPAPWTLSIVELASGATLTRRIAADDPRWVIAFAAETDGTTLADAGPRHLE